MLHIYALPRICTRIFQCIENIKRDDKSSRPTFANFMFSLKISSKCTKSRNRTTNIYFF